MRIIIHSSRTAPAVALIKEPIIPAKEPIPVKENIQPPIILPITPNIMFPNRPKLSLPVILSAKIPATMPMAISQMILIF